MYLVFGITWGYSIRLLVSFNSHSDAIDHCTDFDFDDQDNLDLAELEIAQLINNKVPLVLSSSFVRDEDKDVTTTCSACEDSFKVTNLIKHPHSNGECLLMCKDCRD